MDIYTRIRKQLQNLCQQGQSSFGLFLAEVVSVEQDTTCTVRLNPSLTLSDVQLRAVVNQETTGILIKPAVGSYVLVADLSGGQYTRLAVVMYSEIDRIEINGGENNGLVKIQELTDKLNALVDWCKGHTHGGVITAVSGGSGAPAVGTPGNTGKPTSNPDRFDKADYEDDKITH
jgi:hypothetical protein